MWEAGYPTVASDSPGPVPTYHQAAIVAAALYDPVLAGTTPGRWNPDTRTWATTDERSPAAESALAVDEETRNGPSAKRGSTEV